MFRSSDEKVQIDVVKVNVEVPTKYVNLIKKIAEDLFNNEGFETWTNQTHPAVGRILYAARVRANLNQKEFCSAVKVAPTTLSKMENGKAEITPEYAEKFAKVLNISKDLLLTK